MKKRIWIFLLCCAVFARLESQASDTEPDLKAFAKEKLTRSPTVRFEPMDYREITYWSEVIANHLFNGEPVPEENVRTLLKNVQCCDPLVAGFGLAECIKFLGSLMKISLHGGEEAKCQRNIDAFLQTLTRLAETEPEEKIKEVLLLVQQKYKN
jgi:hypothetical protein